MKVLIFIDWYSPGFKAGGPVRSCVNLVSNLEDEIDFRIITRDTDYASDQPYPGIEPDRWTVSGKQQIWYASQKGLSQGLFRKLISEFRPDVIYLNSMFSFWFTLVPIFLARKVQPKPKVILASRGMLASSALSLKKLKKQLFLAAARVMGLYRDVVFQASSETEADDIRKNFPDALVQIAANLPAVYDARRKIKPKKAGELRLLSVARVSPEKNLLFALEVLKKCKAEISFRIAGPVNDADYWKKCLGVIETMPSTIRVEYLGPLEPSRLHAEFENAHAFFLPTLGENFGHAIFEAMSEGCPVIISDRTIFRNLKWKKAGFDLSLSQPGNFVLALEELASMEEMVYRVWSDSAIRYSMDMAVTDNALADTRKLFGQ